MSNICINIQRSDSPESVAKLYVDYAMSLDFDDLRLKTYIKGRSRQSGKSEEFVKTALTTEYNKLIAGDNPPSITIEDALPKNIMNDRLEELSSLPSSLGLTAALWNSFGVFAENKFKLLNWRYALLLKPIKTNEDINLAIKEVLISTFKELADKAFINVNTNDVNESNIYEKLLMFFKDGQHKIRPESAYYNHYLLLTNPDTAIKLVLNNRVKIPTGYFNIHNNNKQYVLKHTNLLLNTWTTEEEDLDDMENVSKVTKAIFESIPRYKFINGNFILSDSLATFNGIIGGYNLLQEYLYRVPAFDRNNNEADSLWGLIANRSLNIYTVYDILEQIFTKDEDGNDSKFITLFKDKYRPSLENLYSLYLFLTELQDTGEFERVLLEIYSTLNTTTLQKFSSFLYNKDKEIIEHKLLDPLDSDYSSSDYTKLLRVAYSAKNKWFNFNIDQYSGKEFLIPNTDIVVKLTNNSQHGLTFLLSQGNKSLKEFYANTKFEVGTFGIDNLKEVISIKDLGTLLDINNTALLAEYNTIHPYILAVDLIRCSIINLLIQSSSNTIVNPVYGTTIQNEVDFKKLLETLIKIPQNNKAQKVVTFKTINDAWALEPFTVNYYDIYKPVVYMRNDLLDKPVSTMVKTSEGTTLNTNKLSQRGNLFYESTADLRADKLSPSNHFILYLCFAGGHVLRDVLNSDGEVKKAINLNPEEHLTASYIYDYINRIYLDAISLPGPVVSDKSWIPRIDLHMNRSFEIDGKFYTLKKILVPFDAANKDEVKNKKLRESTELLLKLTCLELYNYYKKQKDFVDLLYQNLRKLIIENEGLSVVKNVLESKGLLKINEDDEGITEELIKSWFNPTKEGNYYALFNADISLKSVKSDIIHALIAYSQTNPESLPLIDWIENLCDCWDGLNLTINPLLEYNLKRYDLNSLECVDWFNRMHDLYISDLIKNNIALKGGSNSLGWLNEYEYHIFATLKIPGKEDLKLTGRSSLLNWEVYRELESVLRFLSSIGQENTIPEYIRINSPQFSITKFVDFIQSNDYVKVVKFYRGYLLYKKELKDLAEKNQQTISTEEIRNNFNKEAAEKEFLKKYIDNQDVTKFDKLELEFNPNLINYNLVSKLFEEEFLNSTVGTYLTHPAKGKSIEEKLKNAIGAQIKRNVILSATKTLYLHGRLNTVPNHIKIAIIENLSNDVFNILADELKAGVYSKQLLTDDGATLVDPAFLYLENNSLGENAVGLDKKLFGSYVNPKSGSGFILKTAGFAITNDLMRRSPELYNLSKRMRSLPIDSIDLRIWADYLTQRNIFKAIPTFNSTTGEVSYTYSKLTNVNTDDSGTHSVTWTPCDERGNILQNSIDNSQPVTLNTIHDVWEHVLGGMYSALLSQDGLFKRLTYNNCDLSNKVLSELMCTEQGLNMKELLIAYAPTREAVKYGISNTNTKDVYTDNPKYTMTYMTINTYDLGVQLDAEHSAFESRVSLMTLVMNAAAARGYSIKQGDSLYNALYQITKLSIQDCFDAFVLGSDDVATLIALDIKALNRIASLILEVLNSSGIGASNLLDVLTSTLQKEMLSDEAFASLRSQIPIDDPSILRQILSKFTSSLQSHAVRLKFPGGQYVLAPSDGRILLWDGKTLDEYGGKLNKDVIDFLERKTLNNPQITNFAEIKFGKAYRYRTTTVDALGNIVENYETIILNDPKKYWDFRQKFESVEKKEKLNIKEDVTVPTDLGCEDFIFYDELTGEGYHIWDLYEVWNLWLLMQQYHAATSDEEKQNFLERLKSNQRLLLELLNKLTDYGADASINVVNVKDGSIKKISIDRSRNKYVSFEAILPKYLKKRFNLTDFDTLSTIKKDKFFFYKKALSNMNNVYNTGTMLGADLCLLGSEYNTYLRYTPANTVNNLSVPTNFTEVTPNTILKNGEKWLTTDDGLDLLFRVPTDSNIRIWKHNDTGERVIVTEDVGFFVNQSRFNNVLFFNRLSDNSDDSKSFREKLFNHIKDLEEFSDIFLDEELTVDDFFKSISSQYKEILEQLKNPTKKSTNPLLKSLKNRGIAQHTALLDSLKFIASRTPAQCHQSFMAMECVAFDHSERNVAYVSRWLLWLQGSDFDIDKVNIISHHVYNGRMRLWSPYLNYNKGINYILAANLLPIPTGKEILVILDSNYDVLEPKNIAQLLLIKDVYKHLLGEDNDKYVLISNLIELQVYGTLFINSITEDAKKTKFKDFVATKDQIIYLLHIKNVLGTEKTKNFSSDKFTILSLIQGISSEIALLLTVDISEELAPYEKNPRKYNNLILTKNDVLILALLLLDNPTEITVLPGLPRVDDILTNIINNHNLYLKDKKSNILREGYENFVSKMIWNISADPRNWIQGLISVDTSTGPWKDVANDTPLAKESERYIGASVVGTFNLLTLTLEGKLNVGIIANSLKTLEAISHSIYKTLTYGTTEEILKLFFELKIHGKTINSIANAWVNSEKFATLDENTLEILRALDQDTDAFILLSSLLSLAVDNAKDPTLSKINGNLNMIGLYTTGIILGVSKEDLIDIINSPTGRLVSELMLGNIFNNKKGFSFFNEVINYINSGPDVRKKDFPTDVEGLYKAYKDGQDNLDLSEFMSTLNSLINNLSKIEDKVDTVDQLKKLRSKLYNYSLLLSIIKWDTYQTTVLENGKEVTKHHRRWWDLYRLMKVNSELKQINKGTGLNQGLENSVEGLLQLLHDLSLILVLMVRNKSSNIKKTTIDDLRKSLDGTFVVDMVRFLSDEDYRNTVFNAADTLKHVTNPYKVFWDVVHYRGYIESLATVVEGSKLISNIYNATVTLYPQVISGFSLNKLEKQKMIKRIEEFYHRKRNKLFFEFLGKLFTFTYLKNGVNIKGITLNSEVNRKKFKTIVELEVLPLLLKMFKDNSFIQSLEPKINKRTVDHNVDIMIGSNISTRLETPADKMAFLQAKLDVYKLLKYDILGAPVVSILFAYNLIACDNLNVPNSLSPFFEDLRLTGLSSFIDSYDNFVKQPKTIDGNPLSTLIDEEELNELKNYCAPIRMYAGQDTKSDLIYLWDRKTKSYQLYQKLEEGIGPVTTTNTLFETPAEGININIEGEDHTVIVTTDDIIIKDANNKIINKYDTVFKEVTVTSIYDIIDLISKFNNPNEC